MIKIQSKGFSYLRFPFTYSKTCLERSGTDEHQKAKRRQYKKLINVIMEDVEIEIEALVMKKRDEEE